MPNLSIHQEQSLNESDDSLKWWDGDMTFIRNYVSCQISVSINAHSKQEYCYF